MKSQLTYNNKAAAPANKAPAAGKALAAAPVKELTLWVEEEPVVKVVLAAGAAEVDGA